MTSEVEQEFFRVFGIEPKKCNKKKCQEYSCIVCYNYCKYPSITDRRLLELICILGTVIRYFKIPPKLKLEQLKHHILRNCINEQEEIYIKIQQLFKEEE